MRLQYKRLLEQDIDRELFDGFIRRQVVTKCWRRENGEWTVKDAPFLDDWTEEDYRKLTAELRGILSSGGFVYGAFSGGKLKGFASVDPNRFGSRGEYFDLTQLHVSEETRRRGIGKALFLAAAEWAREKGAGKLYISAHSAVESQAFYRAMGCVEAAEYDPKHTQAEPFDCQLEYRL